MNICIYGASSSIIAGAYINPVEELGARLAKRGHTLVFGGGKYGLMGAAVRGVKAAGGRALAVGPEFLASGGIIYEDCDEIVYTDTMRRRKEIMEDRADAFIITPGGPGTLDEFFEILTLKQLGRHKKPIAVFNVCGYYDNLIKQLENAVREHFMSPENLKLFGVFQSSDRLISYLEENRDVFFETAELRYTKR